MRKTTIFISIIGSLLVILDSVQAGHWVILFLLAGVIPGTDIRISPVDMMSANATALTVIILRVTVWSKFRDAFVSHFTPVASPAKRRTSRRVA